MPKETIEQPIEQPIGQTVKRVTITDSAPTRESDAESSVIIQQGLAKIATGVAEGRVAVKVAESGTPEVVRVKEESPATTPAPDTISLADAKTLIEAAIGKAKEDLETAWKTEKETLEAEKEAALAKEKAKRERLESELREANAKIEQEKARTQNIEDLAKLVGSARPAPKEEMETRSQNSNAPKFKSINFNTEISIGYDKPIGTFKEICDHIDSLEKYQKTTETGEVFLDYDKRELDRYIRENRNQVMRDLDAYGRKRGWFAGKNVRKVSAEQARAVKEAATTMSDLPGGFLATLSAMLRVTHRPGFIFHQLPITSYNFERGRGDTIKIGRFEYLSVSPDLSDYELSGGGTFATIRADSDNLSTSTIDVVVKEFGRGKSGANTAIRPVSIPSFVEYFSAYDLFGQLNMKFGYDYSQFEDRKIRALYDQTTAVWYAGANGAIATNPTSLANGQGVMSQNFARSLYNRAHTDRWEPMPDGCFGLALNPAAFKQLRDDLDEDWEAPTVADLMAFLNMMNPTYIPNETDARVDGYMGKVENLHIFESNAFGVGNAGADGVANVVVRAPSTNALFRTSYLFGHGAVGRGIAVPVEIRTDSVTNFDRETRMSWFSWEGFDTLDVDPAINASQQLRVARIRTTDAPLSGLA